MTSIFPMRVRQAGASAFRKVLVGSLALAAVASAPVASAAFAQAPDTMPIAIDNFAFSPAEITAPVGASITWTNAQPGVPHTTSSIDGVWDSGTLASGAVFTFAFNQPGDFAYQCLIHPSMHGLVHIVAPAASAPAATESATVDSVESVEVVDPVDAAPGTADGVTSAVEPVAAQPASTATPAAAQPISTATPAAPTVQAPAPTVVPTPTKRVTPTYTTPMPTPTEGYGY